MKHPVLKAEKRTLLGKKIKTLRREGILPGNVYGKGLSSVALQVKLEDFDKAHKEAGDTGLIDLQLDGKSHPVLVKNLQMNFRSHTPLHADFYQVNLKEKVKATVPVITVGEPKAVTDKVGMLMQTLSEVEIEALPDKLAENIEINVEHLAELEQHVTVGDLKAPEGVEILTDAGQVVAKIAELVAPEPEPEPEAEAAEGEEGAAPAEGEGGEKPEGGEGEKPAAEGGDKPAEENKE